MDTAQPSAVARLDVGVLGPLQVRVDGRVVDVPGRRRQTALALLAMAGGRTVSVDALIDALWRDEVPDTGAQALHSQLSRLRGNLGPAAARLQRHGAGYALHLDPDELDATVVRRLAATVTDCIRSRPAEALAAARDAVALWRGTALGEFGDVAPLAADAVGLDELHKRLEDDLLEARLATGDTATVLDAAAAAAGDPLRERTVTLLMRGLAMEGRPAEAMQAAAAFRRRLAEETGLDPSPSLAELERDIASGALGAPAASGRRVARPQSPLVGREREREELHRLLASQATVTVTGPGGVGKTRLILDVVADLSERGTSDVEFVGLATLTAPERLPEAVGSALGLRLTADPSATMVAHALAGRSMLLVLDNCEHVAAAARELITEVQRRGPGVRVLASSRVSLHTPGEYVVRLQPLPLPRDTSRLQELAQQPSVRAFLAHADRRQRGGFALSSDNAAAVIEVIRRLDGLPLAIELAAGQLTVLPIAALQQRLGRALDALAADRPDDETRHRTLRTTIDWSYRLLDDGERALLRAMATFPGGLDLDTVEGLAAETAGQVDPLVLLSRLVDSSLVVADQQAGARYSLLDTVRAYLLDTLDASGGRRAADQRFMRWARRTAQQIGQGLRSEAEPAADQRLRAELPNLRAARDLAGQYRDFDLRLDITLALDEASVWRDISELWVWSRELVTEPTLRGHRQEVAALGSAAEASWLLGDLVGARLLAQRGVQLAAQPGSSQSGQTDRCWSAAAAVALFQADFAGAQAAWLNAAATSSWPAGHLAGAALAAGYAGDLPAAEQLLAQARDANARIPSLADRAFIHYVAGEIAAEPQDAAAEYTTAVELARRCGASFVNGVATVGLASMRNSLGQAGDAATLYTQLLDYWQRTGNETQLWNTARNAGVLLLENGSHRTAALLLIAADATPAASSVEEGTGDQILAALARLPQQLGSTQLAAIQDESRTMSRAELFQAAQDALRDVASRHPAASASPDDNGATARGERSVRP